jgi:DNA-binding NtrC family response regulator
VSVNVRIIAATNVHLEQAVDEGSFRQDLFYRLSVFPIHLPPLRERREDIPLLMRHFLDELSERHHTEPPVLSAEALQLIMGHRWPGNVRQLRAMCERWVITHGGRRLEADDIGPALGRGSGQRPPGSHAINVTRTLRENTEPAIHSIERSYLSQLLQRHDGHQAQAAEAAGITRRTLYAKLKEYGIDAGDYRP